MDLIENIITKNYKGKENIFVFPAEVAARHNQRRALSYLPKKTLRDDVFISWDQFKERAFNFNTDYKPVNDYIRALFLDNILSKNINTNLFKAIIRPEFADNSPIYASNFKKILPLLYKIEHTKGFLSRNKSRDLERLYSLYKDFLERNHLYEPNYKEPVLKPKGRNFFIFFPEVIKDFESFRPLLEHNSNISLISSALTKASGSPAITMFANSLLEIKWALLKIGTLLGGGVPPAAIVITAANLEELRPYLQEQARLYNIELDIHQGLPLLSYPGVNFLSQLKDVYISGMGVYELKALLGNSSVPWRNSENLKTLLDFGIRFNCLKNYFDAKKLVDVWQLNFKRLSRCKKVDFADLETVSSLYKNLKSRIQAVSCASDFRELKKALTVFTRDLISEQFLSTEEGSYYQFAVSLLDELIENGNYLDLTPALSPFSLWLSFLQSKLYVKQLSKKGIAVYPYRVSAGIFPEYHFIINASQSATEYLIRSYPFLTIDEESALEKSDNDMTENLLELYSASGKNVHFSYSLKGSSQTHLAPGFFIATGKIVAFTEQHFLKQEDLYSRELALWPGGDKATLKTIYPLQKQGFFQALATCLCTKASDYSKTPIKDAPLLKRIQERLPRQKKLLRITPTCLELYSRCAFSYMLTKVLELSEVQYTPVLLDSLWYGTIIHTILQRFFQVLQNNQESFNPQHIKQYLPIMEQAAASVFNYQELCKPLTLIPLWQDIKARIIEGCFSFLEVEAETFPDFQVAATEKLITRDWREHGIALRGKIDRISHKNLKYAIVDYKARSVPAKREITGNGNPPEFLQMPFYIYLIQEKGMQVQSASYYSFEKAKYSHVFNPEAKTAMLSSGQMQSLLIYLKEKIIAMAQGIEQGCYIIPRELSQLACRYCSFRAVCRVKFVLA